MGRLASAPSSSTGGPEGRVRDPGSRQAGPGTGVPGPAFLGRDDSGSRRPVSRGPPGHTSPGGPVPTPGPRASAPSAPATRTRPPARAEVPHQTIVLSNTILPPSLCGPAPGLANNSASDWPSAGRQSQNSASPPPRLRAPRCVLGLVGAAAAVEGQVIRRCLLPCCGVGS